MPIEVDIECPDCSVELTVEEDNIGESLDCPQCGSILDIEWDSSAPVLKDGSGGSKSASSAGSPKTSIRRPGGGKKLKVGGSGKKLKMGKRRPMKTGPSSADSSATPEGD